MRLSQATVLLRVDNDFHKPTMSLFVLALSLGALCSQAHDISADVEECQLNSESETENMYLIQKKLEVGVGTEDHIIAVSVGSRVSHLGDDCKDDNGGLQAGCTANPAMCQNMTGLTCGMIKAAKACDKVKAFHFCDKSCGFCKVASTPAAAGATNNTAGESGAQGTASNVTYGVDTSWSHWEWPWSNWTWESDRSFGSNVLASWDVYLFASICTWLVWVVLALLIWGTYFPAEPERFNYTEDPLYTFQRQHFLCNATGYICLCSFFCPAVQWADNVHLAGFLNGWVALLLFLLCALLNTVFLCGVLAVGVCTSTLVFIYRQRLRKHLGLESWSIFTCFVDMPYVCCCLCCAIAQEAQVVRQGCQFKNESVVNPGFAYLPNSNRPAQPLDELPEAVLKRIVR